MESLEVIKSIAQIATPFTNILMILYMEYRILQHCLNCKNFEKER